jgi:uncharacterized protein YbjQ (UPF0145 family)
LAVYGRELAPPSPPWVSSRNSAAAAAARRALHDSREQVIERMVAAAEEKGADAIVAMRFDTSEMGGVWTEIVAYGTAVKARKL